MDYAHTPVMLREVLQFLNPGPGDVAVDCTLGGAGHSARIAERIGPAGFLLGIDRDQDALAAAERTLSGQECAIRLVQGNYALVGEIVGREAPHPPDCVLFDFGVSSYQLDSAERGFTFREDAPLDMRMDASSGMSAADLVNTESEDELERIIREYGEERWAARIAQFIVDARHTKPILTTGHLVGIILAAVPRGARREGPHPARRTFQALRIAVNDELGAIRRGLEGAIECAAPGARIVAISYHSLEDRIAKEAFRSAERPCTCPPSMPECICGRVKQVDVITRKPALPSEEEIALNPRARSAKLRAVRKVLGL